MNAMHQSYHQTPNTPGGTKQYQGGNYHGKNMSSGNNYQISKGGYYSTGTGKVRQPGLANNNIKKYSKQNLNKGESTGHTGNQQTTTKSTSNTAMGIPMGIDNFQ